MPTAAPWAADPDWTDYTFTCKARKLAGAEGFLILFRVKDDKNFCWWNVGGWGNSRHNIEESINGSKTTLADDVPGQIDTGTLVQPARGRDRRPRPLLPGQQTCSRRPGSRPAPPMCMSSPRRRDNANGDILAEGSQHGRRRAGRAHQRAERARPAALRPRPDPDIRPADRRKLRLPRPQRSRRSRM